MSNSEQYRITGNSGDIKDLKQFYSTLDEAKELAQEYADDYGEPVEIAEWAYGEWHDMLTVEPTK